MSTIRFERSAAIGSIVLANPPLNRIDLRYAPALREAVHAASESDIRVLMVRAEGPNFSMGGEVREWPGKDINWFRTFVAEVNTSYRAIEALRVPTVAVVRGLAFGGGFELALACDLILATESAQIGLVETTLGLFPLMGGVPRAVARAGLGRGKELAMLGRRHSAATLERWGLINQVVPDEELANAGLSLARQVAAGPTVAYRAVKRLANATVTGFVPDMRDYIAKASVVVLPLRVGAGTKHRVFQAMCMKKPVVCTAVAAEGIALTHGETAMLADDPETFATATVSLLQDAALRQRLGERGRQLVLDRYDWRAIYERLEEAFQEAVRKRK